MQLLQASPHQTLCSKVVKMWSHKYSKKIENNFKINLRMMHPPDQQRLLSQCWPGCCHSEEEVMLPDTTHLWIRRQTDYCSGTSKYSGTGIGQTWYRWILEEEWPLWVRGQWIWFSAPLRTGITCAATAAFNTTTAALCLQLISSGALWSHLQTQHTPPSRQHAVVRY